MTDGKPTVAQIIEASKNGHVGNGHSVQYEAVEFHGVKLLMREALIENAIKLTHEFTHDPEVEELAKEMGITLRRFR